MKLNRRLQRNAAGMDAQRRSKRAFRLENQMGKGV